MATNLAGSRAGPRYAISRFWAIAFSLAGLGGCDAVYKDDKGAWRPTYRTFNVPSASMQPSLKLGDYFLADSRASQRQPARGTLVVYRAPNQDGVLYVKRVIGFAGDTVAIAENHAIVNGKALDEPYIDGSPPNPAFAAFPPVAVPSGSIYVLGDNRSNSMDSRFPAHGFIPIENIVASPACIYWSKEWSRIGKRVK